MYTLLFVFLPKFLSIRLMHILSSWASSAAVIARCLNYRVVVQQSTLCFNNSNSAIQD